MKIVEQIREESQGFVSEEAGNDRENEGRGHADSRDIELGRPVQVRRQMHDKPLSVRGINSLSEWIGKVPNPGGCEKHLRRARQYWEG
jgi:hypothetical protein